MSDWFRTYGFADVSDGLLIGAYPIDADDVATLARLGTKRVLNLVEDQEYRPGERDAVVDALSAAGIEEQRIGLTDYGGLSPEELETAVQEVSAWLNAGVRTYLHCRAGWQRSPTVAAGVLALRDGLDIDEALAYVRRRKPSADPLPHQRQDLHRWWDDRHSAAEESEPELAGAVPDELAGAVPDELAGAVPDEPEQQPARKRAAKPGGVGPAGAKSRAAKTGGAKPGRPKAGLRHRGAAKGGRKSSKRRGTRKSRPR